MWCVSEERRWSIVKYQKKSLLLGFEITDNPKLCLHYNYERLVLNKDMIGQLVLNKDNDWSAINKQRH